KLLCCLDFNDELVVHEQIRAELPDHMIPEKDRKRNLRFHLEAGLAERNDQRIDVHAFQESRPELIVDSVEGPYNAFRKLTIDQIRCAAIQFRVSHVVSRQILGLICVYRLLIRVIRVLRLFCQSDTHLGLRFSRNAAMPSWPSGETRRRAMRAALAASMATGPEAAWTLRTRALALAAAMGPALSRRSTWRCTAVSSAVASTTWWSRPMRRASCASKISALANQRRAWRGPMAVTT